MSKQKQKSGTITEFEKYDALSVANKLLDKEKKKEKNKVPVRVDENTIILVKNSLSEKEKAERVALLKQQMENNKIYYQPVK